MGLSGRVGWGKFQKKTKTPARTLRKKERTTKEGEAKKGPEEGGVGFEGRCGGGGGGGGWGAGGAPEINLSRSNY